MRGIDSLAYGRAGSQDVDRGEAVRGNHALQPGTAIAMFGQDGRYFGHARSTSAKLPGASSCPINGPAVGAASIPANFASSSFAVVVARPPMTAIVFMF